MDQVRAIAKIIWEQRFWVLSVLGLIVAVVCWNMASGALDAEFATRKQAIDGQFAAMQGLEQKTVHPNQEIIDKNTEQVQKQTEIVHAVWKELYARQKEAVLKWPAELGDEFLTYIENLKFKDPINSRMRSIYQNYIGKRFKGLLEIVDALETAEGSMGGYGGGRGGELDGGRAYAGSTQGAPGQEDDYLVEWLDQEKLRAKLAFATKKPSALQIWVTQEDLWVYETLLHVIANTNKARNATRPDNTAIRTILSLEVGAGASQGMGATTGHVYMPLGSPAGGGVGGEMMSEMDRGSAYSAEGAAGGYAGEGDYSAGRGGGYGEFAGGLEGADSSAIDAALMANRYLGSDEAPIADGSGDLGKEFRQLPVRMELVMDQRYIQTLLLECANSPLPIDVKQVRINPDKAMAGFDSTGGASGGYSSGSGANVTINDPSFALVLIKGVVLIYNVPTDAPEAAPAVDDGQLAAGQ